MNSTLFTLSLALPLLLICAVIGIAFLFHRRGLSIDLANIGEGTHGNGALSKRTDAAHASRYLLGKFGSDVDHVAIAGAADVPLFLVTDEAAAAEDLVACQLLAVSDGTVKMVTNGAGVLAAGDLLVPAAGGKVAKKAAGAGNYYIVGIALQAAAATDGLELEVVPIGAWQTN